MVVNYVFDLELTGAIFDRFISVGAVALVIIFQTEIRSFFYGLGARFNMERVRKHWSKARNAELAQRLIDSIVLACSHMSASKTGALIVLTQQQELKEYVDTGEIVDAVVSVQMIENIFFKNTRYCHAKTGLFSNNYAQRSEKQPFSRYFCVTLQ